MLCEKCKKEIDKEKKPKIKLKNKRFYKKMNWYRADEVLQYIYCEKTTMIGEHRCRIDVGVSFYPDGESLNRHWENNYLDFHATDFGDLSYVGLLKEITKEEFFKELRKLPLNLNKKIDELEGEC